MIRRTLVKSPWISPSAPNTILLLRNRGGDEQGLLVPDEILFAVHREFVVLAHENRRDRASLFAITAEDAAGFVDLVHLGVARPCLDRSVVLRRFEVDGVSRAGHRAESAGDALLEAVFVPHQHLFAAVLRENRDFLVGVIDGDWFPEDVLE